MPSSQYTPFINTINSLFQVCHCHDLRRLFLLKRIFPNRKNSRLQSRRSVILEACTKDPGGTENIRVTVAPPKVCCGPLLCPGAGRAGCRVPWEMPAPGPHVRGFRSWLRSALGSTSLLPAARIAGVMCAFDMDFSETRCQHLN